MDEQPVVEIDLPARHMQLQSFYPATPELARALYVAATRARDWLWVLTPETWSPLVSP